MTDLEMDLMIANARIAQLERELAEERAKHPKKCSFGDGITFKPDGVNELDPCFYETIEHHENVDINILRCKRCGCIEVEWYYPDEEDMEDGDVDG